MNTAIRVDDAGLYQVGWTPNGIEFTPVGDPFAKPRQAIDYSNELEGWGPRTSRSTSDPDLARLGTESRDEAPASSEASRGASLIGPGTCVVCGDPLPPGSRRQRRTCSGACRERAQYRRAHGLPEADADSADDDLTVSEPSEPAIDPRPSLGL